MSRATPAFVVGAGQNALAVARSLGRRRVPVHVFDQHRDDLAYRSRYVSPEPLERSAEAEEVVAQLQKKAALYPEKPVLFVTSDHFIDLLAPHSTSIDDAFRADLPAPDVIHTIADKARFARFADAKQLPVPKTCVPHSTTDLEAQIASLRFPVVLKPSWSHHWRSPSHRAKFGGAKMMLAENADALRTHWRALAETCEALVVQEYIPGCDDDHYSYCGYLTRANELIGLCVRKLRLQPIGAGAASAVEVVRDREIEAIGRETLRRIRLPGVASVCFKRDDRTGSPLIHEINARLPFWHSAFQMTGIDLPYLVYADRVGIPVDSTIEPRIGARWVSLPLDVQSFADSRRLGKLSFLAWLRSYGRVRNCAEFAWDDWGPFRATLGTLARRVGRRFF